MKTKKTKRTVRIIFRVLLLVTCLFMITYGAFGTVCGVIKWLPNNWEDSIWWSMVGMSLSILGPVIPMFIFASGIGAIYEMAHEKPKAPTSRRK